MDTKSTPPKFNQKKSPGFNSDGNPQHDSSVNNTNIYDLLGLFDENPPAQSKRDIPNPITLSTKKKVSEEKKPMPSRSSQSFKPITIPKPSQNIQQAQKIHPPSKSGQTNSPISIQSSQSKLSTVQNPANRRTSNSFQPISLSKQPKNMQNKPLSIPKQPISLSKQHVNTTNKPISIPKQPTNTQNKPISIPKQPTSTQQISKQPTNTQQISIPKQPANKQQISIPKQPTSTQNKSISIPKQPTSTQNKSISIPKQPTNTQQISIPKQPANKQQISIPKQPTSTQNKSISIPKQPANKQQISIPKQPTNAQNKPVSIPKQIKQEKERSSIETQPLPRKSVTTSSITQSQSSSVATKVKCPRRSIIFITFLLVGDENTTNNGKPEIKIKFSSQKYGDIVAEMKEKHIDFTINNQNKTEIFIKRKHYEIVEKLCKTKQFVKVEPLSKMARVILKKELDSDGDKRLYAKISNNISSKLYDFQRDGVYFGLEKQGRVLIGDEMGLGKTVQAIALLSAYQHKWPALIIAPNSLIYQWCDQLQFWLGLEPDRITTFIPSVGIPKNFDFLVSSYESIVQSRGLLLTSASFKIVVCDECHFLKNPRSKRATETMEICARANHVILLSGTPALSRPSELYTLCSIILPNIGSFEEYGKRYCLDHTKFIGKIVYTGSQNTEELNYILNTFMIRRRKDEVLGSLPQKEREKIYIGKPKYDKILSKINKALDESKTETERKRNVFELHRSIGLGKLPLVTSYIDDILSKDESKFVVFGYHRDVIDGIVYFLQQKKVKFIRIDGSTKVNDRKTYVDLFRDDKSVRVAVLSIEVANCGMEFQKASLCIFAEMCFVPGKHLQAEDRIHRIGQEATHVRIQYLVANDSFDNKIWEMLVQKVGIVGKVLDNRESEEFKCETSDQIQEETVENSVVSQLLKVLKNYDERMLVGEEERERIQKRKMSLDGVEPSPKRLKTEDTQIKDGLSSLSGEDETKHISSSTISRISRFSLNKK
ncbi:Non-specific serine/threonine protein kinase [Entamoeba marina]